MTKRQGGAFEDFKSAEGQTGPRALVSALGSKRYPVSSTLHLSMGRGSDMSPGPWELGCQPEESAQHGTGALQEAQRGWALAMEGRRWVWEVEMSKGKDKSVTLTVKSVKIFFF